MGLIIVFGTQSPDELKEGIRRKILQEREENYFPLSKIKKLAKKAYLQGSPTDPEEREKAFENWFNNTGINILLD